MRTGTVVLVSAGVLVSLLTVTTSAAPSDPATNPAAGRGAGDDPTLVGLAAIAGAGLEVRHVMKAEGPDPSVDLTLDATPSPSSPSPSPSGSPSPSAGPSPSASPPGRRAAAAGSAAGIPVAWHSGAAGDTAVDGSFAAWRGEPLQIMGTWNDTTAASQRDIGTLSTYAGWNGDLDLAIGALAPGESWSQAASGAYADRWTQAVRNIRAARSGKPGMVYVRFAHEMTGDWFTWKVNSGNVADFKTAWRLFHGILKREYPRAKLVFSPNDGNHSDVSVDQIWPGDAVVDVVGPDTYDGYPNHTSESDWQEWLTAEGNGPKGPGAWRAFAAAHGKPLAFPEWGIRNMDNPFFITKMHEFLASCAPRPGDTDLAGKCIYDIYFNITNSGNAGFKVYGGPNPRAGDAYRRQTWGTR